METRHDPLLSGNTESNPSEEKKKPRPQKSPFVNPTRPVRKKQNSELENEEAEINPAKFDREQIEPDIEGHDDSKSHEPYEFKHRPLKKVEEGKLLAQGGYGTSGTNGTNSAEKQD